jgi:hypothetical protein
MAPILECATDAGRGGTQLRDGEVTHGGQRSVSSIGRREASAVRWVLFDRAADDRVVFDVFRVEPDRCLLLQPSHRR